MGAEPRAATRFDQQLRECAGVTVDLGGPCHHVVECRGYARPGQSVRRTCPRVVLEGTTRPARRRPLRARIRPDAFPY